MRYVLFSLFLIFCIDAASAEVAWRDVSTPVDNILRNRERAGFGPTGQDTLSNRRLDGMLDEAVSILTDNPGGQYRKDLAALRDAISSSRERIAKLRFEAAGAPEGSGSILDPLLAKIGLGGKTKSSYEARIANEQRSIAEKEARYAALEEAFLKDLSGIGINLTRAQMKGLMAMATADDIIAMQSAFENMKSINRELQDATVRSDESLDVARRYYGIYAVMLEIALRMHDNFISRVDDEYLMRLSKIVQETAAAREEAEGLATSTLDKGLKEVLARNISAQKLTLEAANAYRQRLIEQRDRIAAARHRIGLRHEVAVNSWKTVRLSSDLVGMIRSTGKDFDTLLSLDIPDLRPFQSIELQREFERLTRKIDVPSS